MRVVVNILIKNKMIKEIKIWQIVFKIGKICF